MSTHRICSHQYLYEALKYNESDKYIVIPIKSNTTTIDNAFSKLNIKFVTAKSIKRRNP